VKNVLTASLIAIFAFLFLTVSALQAVISQDSVRPSAVSGKRIFNQSCSACHDTLGATPKSGPELKDYYRHQPLPTDATVRTIIQQGKGKMPAFSTLNTSRTDDLIAYLKTL
jgi:mono/diheme cytochrome c family protein